MSLSAVGRLLHLRDALQHPGLRHTADTEMILYTQGRVRYI